MWLARFFLSVTFCACAAWAYNRPGWDSICAALGALAALALTFAAQTSSREGGQVQEMGTDSIGIQAGRDVNIHQIDKKS